jgi:hypothetical protein
VVALLDDGSLRRWRKSTTEWQEISHTDGTTGRESFRLRTHPGIEDRTVRATTQLGYNNAIAVGESTIYFGVGQILQQLVNFITYLCLRRV